MRKRLYIFVLLVVAAPFTIHLFVDNESIHTISNVIGFVVILVMAVVLRVIS